MKTVFRTTERAYISEPITIGLIEKTTVFDYFKLEKSVLRRLQSKQYYQ